MICFPARKYFLSLLFVLAGIATGYSMVVESGKTIIIDQPVYEDIYLVAGTVIINAPVHGDVVIAGGYLYVNDTVSRDLLMAGGSVRINGYVAGKVRCLGGTLQMSRMIGGDLVVAGGDIRIDKGAVVGGSVLARGGKLTINGNVQEDVRATVSQFRLYGTVGRSLECRGATLEIDGKVTGTTLLAASNSLLIGYSAEFKDSVRYWAPAQVDFGKSLQVSPALREEGLSPETGRWYFFGGAGLLSLLWYVGMALLLIALLQYFFAPALRKAGNSAYNNLLKSLGTGFLFFCAVPVLIFLSFISLVGIPVGVILLFGFIFLLMICGSFTAVVAANWLNNRSAAHWKFWRLVWTALGFFILLRLILVIPLLGWILFSLLVCIAMGAFVSNVHWKRRAAPVH